MFVNAACCVLHAAVAKALLGTEGGKYSTPSKDE